MTRRLSPLASFAASLVILPALTGCVLQKRVVAPPGAVAPPPGPEPTPLYTTELAQSDQSLPNLPAAPVPAAQPAPPPVSEVQFTRKRTARRTRIHKGEGDVAERDTKEAQTREAAQAGNTETASADPGAGPGIGDVTGAKVTAKAPAGDTSVATPIGQLTAGPTQDSTQSRRQAVDLIQSTERGVNSLHRGLSGDESKTVTQIRGFLQQAEHALHNGDIDGAVTLATKAKVLLTELTGTE